jgi:hypothetical protein
MAAGRFSARNDRRGRGWRKRARARLSLGLLKTLMRLRAEIADRPRRIDRFIDYFGGTRRAQPARG